MTPRIWSTWLPPDIVEGIIEEEPRRFAALAQCVVRDVDGALRDEADPNRWHRLVKWLSYINTFNSLHADYPAEHVKPLAEALWRVVAEAWSDLEVQVRVAECLTKLLRAHKRCLRKARLLLPWRPVFAVLQRLYGTPQPKLEGVGLTVARGTALVKLVTKARRFFAAEALGEVWAELRPVVRAVGLRPSEGYEALGYLQLFAPTHNICTCRWSSVNGWVEEWMAAWDGLANSAQWDSLWLGLIARAAKHDWRGVIRWQPHLPALFTTLTALFDVPIGATGSRGATELVGRPTPGRATVLFGDQMGYGVFHGSRLVVSLLRCTAPPDARAAATSASAAEAAHHLERMTALLEQYFHPSNTGKWCRELSTLLKHLVKAAVKQLERQQPPQPQPDSGGAATASTALVYDDDDDFPYAYDAAAAGEDEAVAPSAEGGVAVTPEGSPAAPFSSSSSSSRHWASELREPELQRLVGCCLTMAARGQFSKDSGLANVSVKALSQLALLDPPRVLPLVLERFRTALATATATHQLVAAVATLALCARPMMLAGWSAAPGLGAGAGAGSGAAMMDEAEEGAEGERESAAQLVSEALMAALPGLDANDEPKTNAVLQLYVSVLSALPRLRGAGEGDDEGDDSADAEAARQEEEEHTFARAPSAAGAGGAMDVDKPAPPAAAAAAGGPGLSLSLYVAEWAEEVLERCLALLRNLDSGPAHRGTDLAAGGGGRGDGGSTSSFLVGARSLFGPLWQLLMHSSRPVVRRHLVQRLAAFVLGGTAPGVATEVGVIAGQAAAAAPRETVRSLVLPLLARVEAEVAELPRADLRAPGPPPHPPSAGQEAALRYQLSILHDTVSQLHADILLAPNIQQQLLQPASGAAPSNSSAVGAAGSEGGPSLELPSGCLVGRLVALADRLAECNSRALQTEAGSLAGAAVLMLGRFWLEPHLPWRRQPGGGAVPLVAGRGVELWVDKFGSGGYRPPRWTTPSAAHLAVASRLVAERLLVSARRLRELAVGAGGAADGGTKLKMRAELCMIRGMLSSALSMLRDFKFGGTADPDSDMSAEGGGSSPAVSLAVLGSVGCAVGAEGTREELAEILADVCCALRGSSSGDPELLDLATRSGGLLLACGSLEWLAAQADERNQRATSHINTDAPVTSRLMPGAVWRRRSPMWVVQARLFNALMTRASAAAFRPAAWCTTRQPELTRLDQFPPSYLVLLRTMCGLAQHPNGPLARQAAAAVDTAVKRFPCLAPVFFPYFLAALADVPYDPPFAGAASAVAKPDAAFFARLRDAALATEPPPPQAAAAATAAAAAGGSEIERDGRVLGSSHAWNGTLNFWRLLSRDPAWLAAGLHALLAGRTHNASVPQKALGDLLLALAGRCLHPPSMSYDRPPYTDLVGALTEAARPGGSVLRGATFRYTVIANVMLALLLPHKYQPAAAGGAAGVEVAAGGGGGSGEGGDPALETATRTLRHMLGLLVAAESPQLRQLGMSGAFIPLCAVVEFGEPMPQLTEVLREAIRSSGTQPGALQNPQSQAGPAAGADAEGAGGAGVAGNGNSNGGNGGWGERLIRSLVLNHTELDSAESMKDKRGGAMLAIQQRVLNMTFEELAGGLAGVPLDRLARWPNDGNGPPAAVAEGRFVVKHARLVQLLAAAAPEEVMAALRDPLEALTTPERLAAGAAAADKADLATAAEALAGLLASGAPWACPQQDASSGGAGGGNGCDGNWTLAALGRAMRVTSLEMSDSWALSYRYALRGLLDGLVPERLHPAAPPPADNGPQPRPLLAPGLSTHQLENALGDVMGLLLPGVGAAAAAAAAAPPAGDAQHPAAAPPEAAAAAAAAVAAASLGLPQQLKRLRCLREAVRELVGLDPAKELPLQVRLFWSALLEELRLLADSPDCLSLRDQLQMPLIDALGYWGAAEGLLGQVDVETGLVQAGEAAARAEGTVRGRGRSAGSNGNGDNDLVHVSAEPSGMSTPAEMEVGDEEAVLLLPRTQAAAAPTGGAGGAFAASSMLHLRATARALAASLASRFNAAANQVQEVRGFGAPPASATPAATAAAAAATTATSGPAEATPNASSGGAAAAGADSPASRATTTADDMVLVEPPEVASVPCSGGASPSAETTTTTGAAAAAAMEVDEASPAQLQAQFQGGTTTNNNGGPPSRLAASPVDPLAAAMSGLGLGLEVLTLSAARHRSPGLRELVVAMLPGLLRLQDVAGPEMQKFRREFQVALLVVKCLSLNTHAIGSAATEPAPGPQASGAASPSPSGSATMLAAALAAVASAAVVEVPWSARAAALSYGQSLWFRHAPLLAPEQMRQLQDMVASRLPDPKSEVRALAAATLSGLLRVTAPPDVEALRNRILAQAADLFGGGKGRRRGAGQPSLPASNPSPSPSQPGAVPAGSQAPGALQVGPQLLSPQQQLQLEKQGCVAGLSALLMSYPYDVPAWLPPVLIALVRAAGSGERDAAVRGEAGRALGEFRRTHEAEALETLRGRMDPDDWDSFSQATGTSSYFV